MCWESSKPPKPSESEIEVDPGDEPIDEPTEDPTEEPTDPAGPCGEQPFGPEEVSEYIVETITNAPPPYEEWNDTFDWYAKFAMAISRTDCAITVTVRLKVEGTITPEQLSAWESAIESKWSDRMVMGCPDPACEEACPGGYAVFVDVQFVDAGEHYVITAQTADATSDGIYGLNGTTGMQEWGVEDVIDVTHEFGHMLGNPEEYFTTNGVDYTNGGTLQGFRDPNGGIMNNPANDPLPSNYYLIAEKAAALMGPSVICTTDPKPP